MPFNGLGRNLGNLAWLSEAQTRSISAENPTGGKGMGGMAGPEPDGPARELGRGWKCRPYVVVGRAGDCGPGRHRRGRAPSKACGLAAAS